MLGYDPQDPRSPRKNAITKPLAVYPRAASMSSLQSLIMEDNSSAMLSDSQRPPSDPSTVSADGLLLLALQERISSQLRPSPSTPFSTASIPSSVNSDSNRLWQSLMLGLPLMPGLPNPLDLNYLQSAPLSHALWQHNLCAWPGCNQPCDSLASFLTHLSQTHTSDERTTADMRAQVELVDTLEHRLTKERARLQAMMQHLHMKHSPDTTTPSVGKIEPTSPLRIPKQEPVSIASTTPISISQPQVQVASPVPMDSSCGSPVGEKAGGGCSSSTSAGAARRSRVSDKVALPISADIARNRDFYRTNDVRPPYTYASLIRQAIMESLECQLTLNEIYTWFTETFAYFRRNAATWKNAVRHNLSLHKCFQRVEQNVKGAVWTVDDSEFYRRRPQRSAATRSQPNTPIPEEVIAQRLLDHSTMSMMDRQDAASEGGGVGLPLNGGLEGVLSFLANSSDHHNPLALLSAAAAASSEHPSSTATPIPKEEVMHHNHEMNFQTNNMQRLDPDATPPAGHREEEIAVRTSC